MESLFKKQPAESVQKTEPESVQTTETKIVQNEPPTKECAGWCGEVVPVSQLKDYRKKLYCPNCYSLKMDELEKAKGKSAGLTEEQVKLLIQNALKKFEIPVTEKLITRMEMQDAVDKAYAALHQAVIAEMNKVKPQTDLQLRDLVIAAKTIMEHFVGTDGTPGLARFTSLKQNGRQGNDMRLWIKKADEVLK